MKSNTATTPVSASKKILADWTNSINTPVLILRLAALTLMLLAGASWSAAAYAPASSPREKQNFGRDWKFIREDVADAEQVSFSDAAWQDVGLPHCYNDQDTFDKIPNGVRGDGGWNGKTWYRKHFTVSGQNRGKQIYLEFEAARTVAKVWLNGTFLGEYKSGFSSFAFDITPHILFGKDNVLAVQVDDTEGEDLVAGNASHWHPALGGLYRPVWLHITDPLHVTLPLFSFLQTEGTYAGALKISQEAADFRMTTEVRNSGDSAVTCELTTEVVAADGQVALTLKSSQEIPAKGLFKFDQGEEIVNPRLWSLKDPHLYTIYSTLRRNGKVTDVYTTPLGLRDFYFDHERSRFVFNGEDVILRGWGQKPTNTVPGLGAALPDWLLAHDIQLMKDGGGNIVRWGHCAGATASLSAGDRLGFFQWQSNISGEGDYKGEIWDNKVSVLRDILIRDRNHPSIVFWEGNNSDVSSVHTNQMKDLVRQWDWIAPRPFANRGPYREQTKALQDFSIEMDGSKEYIAGKAHVESEFYRPESPRFCWDADSPVETFSSENKYFKTQAQAMEGIVAQWKSIRVRGGGVKWHFTDETTHVRVPRLMARTSGVVDALRLPKDIYYGSKVINSDTPQIHIMGHWNYADVHTVHVYSTCEEIELLINGESQGKQPVKDWHAIWQALPFKAGTLKAVGYNGGAAVCADERVTVSEPKKIALEVMTNPDGLQADRADVAMITATIVDKDGRPHPTANNAITFTVSGPGNYRGGANIHLPNTTGKETLVAEAGKIRVSVRSTNQPGVITVTASSPGLESGKVEIQSNAVK